MWGVGNDCRCMEFVTAGSCIGKYLWLDQTVRNLTCGYLEIPFVLIGLGVVRLKKTGLVCLLDFFGKRGKKGECDLVFVEPI